MANKRTTSDKNSLNQIIEQLENRVAFSDLKNFDYKKYSQEDAFKIVCARIENEGHDTHEACRGVMSRTGFNNLLREARAYTNDNKTKYYEIEEEYDEEGEDDKAWILNHYARAKDGQVSYWEAEARNVVYDNSGDLSHVKIEKDARGGQVAKLIGNNEFVQRSKLKLDFIMWKLSHLRPKVYGKQSAASVKKEADGSSTLVFEWNVPEAS